jgi:transposase
MRGDAHVRFGRRTGETGRWKQQHGAPARSHERAVVVCVDEKTGIQALDRTQPILPMRPGQVERRTHDYVRHGITDLFAALNIATGEVVSTTRRRHRAEEFKSFLSEIDKSVPAELDIHVVLDNSSTHKTEAVRNWLLRHPRFHLHFTPTSSSWLNLVWVGSQSSHDGCSNARHTAA